MKGLGLTAKTTSILFLLAVIFISLALSGYTFLVSHAQVKRPIFAEGLTNKPKQGFATKEGVTNKKQGFATKEGLSAPAKK
jgi:hypothetical protein